MRILALVPTLTAVPVAASAQTIPAPVPDNEVFSRDEIGHALAAPTPEARRTAPNAANAPGEDGRWIMPSFIASLSAFFLQIRSLWNNRNARLAVIGTALFREYRHARVDEPVYRRHFHQRARE